MLSTTLKGRKWIGIAQSVLIGAAMLVLVYFTGKVVIGGLGVVAVLISVGLVAFQIFQNPSRLKGVVELDRFNAPELLDLSRRLSARAGLPTFPSLYLVPSPVPNAFTLGGRDDAKIFVTQGLVDRLDVREVAGVLAHEISHIRHNDLLLFRFAELVRQTTTLLSRFGWLLLFFAVPFFLFTTERFPVGLPAILISAPVASLFLQLALFRTREFSADITAVELTRDPQGLASALYKIDRPNRNFLSLLLPISKREESPLFRTHPAVDERIRRLLALDSRPYRASYR